LWKVWLHSGYNQQMPNNALQHRASGFRLDLGFVPPMVLSFGPVAELLSLGGNDPYAQS
jgi:hypothetical protein